MTTKSPPPTKEEVMEMLYEKHEDLLWALLFHAPRQKMLPLTRRDRRLVAKLRKLAKRYEKKNGHSFRIGFDVGRVLAERGILVIGKANIRVRRNYYHRDQAISGMWRLIRILVAALKRSGVVIIKGLPDPKEEPGVEVLTRFQTLTWAGFYQSILSTGFDLNNLLYAERKQKGVVCEERGIVAFVDDRAQVLQHLAPRTLPIAFSPVEKEWNKFRKAHRRAVRVETPQELFQAVCRYLEEHQ